MDYWADSPLNKAHFYDRKAAAYAKKLAFDEAVECHASACHELDKCRKLTTNAKAIQSIDLQHEYHAKQKEFLRLKKLQYQTYREALRVQKEAMSRIMKARGARESESENDNEGANLRKAIFRTIEEADSLLELLVQRDDDDGGDDRRGDKSTGDATDGPVLVAGVKRPKDDNTVIEELKIVNYQLRSLVSELMTKLATSEKVVQVLRQRVAELEAENQRFKADAMEDSTYASPYVFSLSEKERRPSSCDLPTLAPLELPSFDLAVLYSKKFGSGE